METIIDGIRYIELVNKPILVTPSEIIINQKPFYSRFLNKRRKKEMITAKEAKKIADSFNPRPVILDLIEEAAKRGNYSIYVPGTLYQDELDMLSNNGFIVMVYSVIGYFTDKITKITWE